MSVNKVILLGRLGTDPDLKYTPSGAPVAKFSLATSEYFTDKTGNRSETTEWHKIVVWNKAAENCSKYLSKGRQVFIEGKITTVSWDDKQTGQKRYATEIVAQNVQFIGDAPQGNQQRSNPPAQQAQQPYSPPGGQGAFSAPPSLDEIPF